MIATILWALGAFIAGAIVGFLIGAGAGAAANDPFDGNGGLG